MLAAVHREQILQSSDGFEPAYDEERRHIEQAQQGSHSSIDWLITRHRASAVRLACAILRRRQDAEDAAQEAFVRAFANLHTYRFDGKFTTWLIRIVVRCCLDRQRRVDWRLEQELPDYEIASEVNSQYQDVELRLVVEALLARMDAKMRAMIVLRELQGLEYEEIARVVGIPTGRVKWRLHIARKQFQELWREMERERNES